MLSISDFKDRLTSRQFWLMDGAIGTELERRGYQTQLPFWTAYAAHDAPATLGQIYRDYLDTGCHILTTNTFRISWYLFENHHRISQFRPLLEDTCILARNLIPEDSNILLAGSVTTLEDCYRPDLVPARKQLLHYHAKQLESLTRCPVDFILAETINNLSEAKIILQLCCEMELPIILSIITNGRGCFLSGEPMTSLIKTIDRYPAQAISINCRSIREIRFDAKVLADNYLGILGIYPNAPGHPDPQSGWHSTNDASDRLGDFVEEMRHLRYTILGGCCGTTPEMIRSMKERLAN